MACNPRVKGERKQASSPPEHGDCLSATEQLQTCQEVSCRKRSGCRGAQWFGTPFHLTPCVQSRKKTQLRNKRKLGPRRNHSQGRFDAFRFLHNTCCLATVLVGLTNKYKKRLWDMNFRNGLKKESYVTDTLHWKNLLLKWRENTHPIVVLPIPLHLPISPFTWSSRLAIFRIHFYFNPYISYTSSRCC